MASFEVPPAGKESEQEDPGTWGHLATPEEEKNQTVEDPETFNIPDEDIEGLFEEKEDK